MPTKRKNRRSIQRYEQVKIQTRSASAKTRKLPIGAEVMPGGGVHFRVWAPACKWVTVEIDPKKDSHNGGAIALKLTPDKNGYFSVHAPGARSGMLYRFRIKTGA